VSGPASRDVGTSTASERWQDRAACKGHPTPAIFFPRAPHAEEQASEAARACASCPVRTRCAEQADRYHDDGVRGGAWRIAANNGRAARYERILYFVEDAPRHDCDLSRCATGHAVSSGQHLLGCPVWTAFVVDAKTCTCPRGARPRRSVAELAKARDRMVSDFERGRGAAS
jgi:hypothetical protein